MILTLFLWQVSLWSEANTLSETGWPACPRDHPVPAFPALELKGTSPYSIVHMASGHPAELSLSLFYFTFNGLSYGVELVVAIVTYYTRQGVSQAVS